MGRAALFVLMLLLGGCVVSAGSKVPGFAATPTDPDKVEVLYQPPKRPYVVVGFVSVARAVVGNDQAIERKFRAVAATLGGEAVIIEELPKVSVLGVDVLGKGKAIRWQKPQERR